MSIDNRVFVNSVPKSGTNLLKRLLDLLGFRDQNNRSFRRRSYQRLVDGLGMGTPWSLHHGNLHRHVRIRFNRSRRKTGTLPVGLRSTLPVPVPLVCSWLEDVPPGYFFTGHVPWSRSFDQLLDRLGYNQVVIFRDPMDVLESRLKYERNWSRIRYGRSLTGRVLKMVRWMSRILPGLDVSLEDELRNREPRDVLSYLLHGGTSDERNEVNGLLDQYRMMTPWLRSDHTHTVLFRDLIGPKGNASRARQRTAVREVAEFLNLPLAPEKCERVVRRIYSTRSKTFRRGSMDTGQSLRKHLESSTLKQPLDEIYRRLEDHFPCFREMRFVTDGSV